MNRLYVLDVDDYRFAVVHTSLKEAKKWLWDDSDVRGYCDNEYVLFNPHWLKGIDVSDLEIGDDLISVTGVERGVYEWVDDKCPRCGKTGKLRIDAEWGVVCCSDCNEDIYQEYKAALYVPCDAHVSTKCSWMPRKVVLDVYRSYCLFWTGGAV